MTFSPVVTNTTSDVDQVNGNYLHVGRCGFSNFYGMDGNGTYTAQPLGSASTPWLSAHIGNINITGNTIQSYDTDGDVNIIPNGTGRVNLSKTFGDWTTSGYVKDTVYQAETDLFVCVYGHMATDGGVFSCYTDSNNPPTTVVLHQSQPGSSGDFSHSAMFPVKKGDYWKITFTDTPTIKTLAFGI